MTNAISIRPSKELNGFPGAGAIPNDRVLRSAGYRFAIHKEYLIFYLTDEQQKINNVMAIFNSKKDYMKVMKKFL